MKILIAFLMLAILAMSFTAPVVPEKYGFGFRKAVNLTSDTSITLAPGLSTLTFYTLPLDTNAVLNATLTNCIMGDRVVLKVTADASTRQISFTGNITAVADSVVANKTKLFEFIYDGSKFLQLSEQQIN